MLKRMALVFDRKEDFISAQDQGELSNNECQRRTGPSLAALSDIAERRKIRVKRQTETMESKGLCGSLPQRRRRSGVGHLIGAKREDIVGIR